MGNRVYLELRGTALPGLAEEDEEAVACLAANNSLPLFWLSLLRERDLDAEWEATVRHAFADPEGGAIAPIRLDWTTAKANLAAARAAAELRLPDLFPRLRDWEAGLHRLASRGPAQEVRLCLAEHANFFDDAAGFLDRLRQAVRLWHGPGHPVPPPVENAGIELTGFTWLTDEPFPAVLPAWEPGRPATGWPQQGEAAAAPAPGPGQATEWGMVGLFSAVVLGAAWLGARFLGTNGSWAGGILGFVLAAAAVWGWAKRLPPR